MCRVCQCLHFADKEWVTSQSFMWIPSRKCAFCMAMFAFCRPGIYDFIIVFLWRPSRIDVPQMAMFAFCRPGIDDVAIISCGARAGNISRVWQCLLYRPEIDDVTIISCVGRARKMLRFWQCLLFADKKWKTSQPFVVNDDQEI